MEKVSGRSKPKVNAAPADKEEMAHYKSKVKKYRNEILDLREQLDRLSTKYVKVCNDKEKYKQKIADTKDDIINFNKLVEEKSNQKAGDIKKDLDRSKRSLKKKDKQIKEKDEENKQLRNQVVEQDEYVQSLEARIEELLNPSEEKDEKIMHTPDEK
jgi:chromosome segregation ATPase